MNHRIKRIWSVPFAAILIRLASHLRRTFHRAGVETRKYPRVPLSIRVTRVTTGSFSFYHAHNISAGGMFLKSLEPPPRGTEFQLRFSLFPDQADLEVHAVVVWVQPPAPDGAGVPGMGIQFTAVPAEARREIERFVEMKM